MHCQVVPIPPALMVHDVDFCKADIVAPFLPIRAPTCSPVSASLKIIELSCVIASSIQYIEVQARNKSDRTRKLGEMELLNTLTKTQYK